MIKLYPPVDLLMNIYLYICWYIFTLQDFYNDINVSLDIYLYTRIIK